MDLLLFLRLPAYVINFLCRIITFLYYILTYLLWMRALLLPLRILNPSVYWYVEGILCRWVSTVIASWSWRSKYQIVESGDDISMRTNERCLFLVNHQSTADVPLLMLVFQEKGSVLESIMWIIARQFRYTPFGIATATHGDYFVTQGKNVRDNEMKKLRDHLLKVYLGRNRKWIILFPEGGFLSKLLESSVKYATKNNFPVLEYVTLPKIGAIEVILKTLAPQANFKHAVDDDVYLLPGMEKCEHIKWVIDATIAYPERHRPLDIIDVLSSYRPPCCVYVHYRCYPINKVPLDSTESLRDWTFKCWTEKEELLKEYYNTGKFPNVPASQKKNGTDIHNHRSHEVTLDNRQLLLIHIFLFSSTLLPLYLMSKVWNFVLH